MAFNSPAKGLKRSALAVALGLCFAGGVQAQSTTGSIYGTVPAGTTVTVQNASGLSRTATAAASGRVNITSLPVGVYTVTINGQARTVTVRAGAGTDVTASTGTTTTLGEVNVVAAAAPLIDITATDTRSVVTSEQINRLPLARSAEAIALLAPGAVQGAAGFFGGLVSFGGAGVSENAYYVNGYFTGEPLSNLGGFSLPFGSIEQQETFIGGYSAKYGRSDGGVINQIGKRGTNEWHFGGQVSFSPKSLRGEQVDRIYPNLDFSEANSNPNLPMTCETDGLGANGLPIGPGNPADENELCQYAYADEDVPGTLFSRGADSTSWSHTYNAYAGGPIIKDRLFMFVSAEWTKIKSETASVEGATERRTDNTNDIPKLYAKIDWNITDNHFLEFTYLGERNDTSGEYRQYDFETGEVGDVIAGSNPDDFRQTNEYAILKYTGYLTDNLTASITYGKGRLVKSQINPSVLPGIPFISNPSLQNPAIVGSNFITNNQGGFTAIDAEDRTHGLRADLEWVIGDHTLTAGIDDITFDAENEGSDQPITRWIYNRATGNIVSGHVGSPVTASNPNGYYVYELIFKTATSMSLKQDAWYLEDRWQVTDNFLLSLGVRNDAFQNTNNFGEKYLDAKNQWAPRIGFAWDVNGDSSFKVFGNAGRYFLAMPNNVAIRGASASTFTREYFTYTGIASDGTPTGLTPVPRTDGGTGPFSANGEYGQPIDVLSFAPSDLKNMYQDEYILGFEAQLTDNWMMGVKLTNRQLKSAIDDICDPGQMAEVLDERGIDPDSVEIPGCFMFNPGGTNTFSLANIDEDGEYTGERTEIVMTSDDWGFPDPMKREYKGVDVYFEHAFDGKWEARVDYTWSKSSGNMEGQVKSEFGQANISKTQDWDAAEIMTFANGYLANDRRHQLKARGSYQLTDELLIGANIRIQSGAPISCLGQFNPGNIDENSADADPIGYGPSYHTCFGKVAKPGALRTPWTKTIDVGLLYRPNYFDKKLALGVQVRNLLNARKATQVDVTSEETAYTVSNTYLLPIGLQAPRTVTFTAAYDW